MFAELLGLVKTPKPQQSTTPFADYLAYKSNLPNYEPKPKDLVKARFEASATGALPETPANVAAAREEFLVSGGADYLGPQDFGSKIMNPQTTVQPQVAAEKTERPPIQMDRYGKTGDMYITNAKEALGLSDDESYIVGSESGFRPEALNPNSDGAFGLGQMIEIQRKKYGKELGIDPNTKDPYQQIQMMRAYIADRYGDAATAVKFRQVTEHKRPITDIPEKSTSGFPLQASAEVYLKKGWIGY